MNEPGSGDTVALVLTGGCARGAYEFGVLSVLLPKLEAAGMRPRIIIGTSVGALNASYLAANAHLPAAEVVAGGEAIWRELSWSDVIGHVISLGSAARALAYAGEVTGWPGARVRSLLDPTPLTGTIERRVDFDALSANVDSGTLHAAAVVTTSALTHRTVVFHEGGGLPHRDKRRLIDYVPASLAVDHVRASTAMPAVFPAVEVKDPAPAAGWYYDGGTRLNAPLKPALSLGADRLVIVGLSSLAPGSRAIAGDARPDLFGGIGLLLRGLIGDQLVQDVHTLAAINEHVRSGERPNRRAIPYMVIAPEHTDTVEQLALEVFRERYGFPGGLTRSADIEIVGRLVGAGAEAANATLLSLLLFDSEFIGALIELGVSDATRWVSAPHDEGLWQLRSL